MRSLYLYKDRGVSSESLWHTQQMLHAVTDRCYQIKTIDATAVSSGLWRRDAAMLVIPGGADLPYAEKLNGRGNQMIKDYVQQGGSYLGICAGAYYAAAWVEFDKGGPLAVCGQRELQFFPGKAVGPLLSPYCYHSNRGASIATIIVHLEHLDQQQPTTLHLLLNGGPYFVQAAEYPQTSVLAYYQLAHQQTAAILSIQYGHGRVVLSGVHLEYSALLMGHHDIYLTKLLPALAASDGYRLKLISQLLQWVRLATQQ